MFKRLTQGCRLLTSYSCYYFSKLVFQNPIRVYYWKDHPNFGDLITPALLRHYGFKPVHFYPHRAQLVSTGSLIEHIPNHYSGVILGTGAIDEKTTVRFPFAKVVGLRGTFTKERLAVIGDIALGDPGLLAHRLLKKRSAKKYKLGLIPHYSDAGNPVLEQIRNHYPEKVVIINVEDEPLAVLLKMDECEHILSSSMHGLICSDALGIPNKWVQLSSLLGGNFKFRDYYSVFNLVPYPVKLSGMESLEELIRLTSMIDQAKLVETQNKLEGEFKSLTKYIYG
ncbi:MAG: polysaccharide pyruvyl transferase family protein [Candidatus Marinimicrobia bacterium]|nr:polysaccharide pyruvyl transferase family protein [Candidatus Neomarinimicrobiota bacterium]